MASSMRKVRRLLDQKARIMEEDNSEDETTECQRIQNIKDIVQQIQLSRKKSKMNKEQKNKASLSAKEPDVSRQNRGKHNVYKMYIGWQHFYNGKYRVVTVKKGDGIRQMEYKADEQLSFQTITERGAAAVL